MSGAPAHEQRVTVCARSRDRRGPDISASAGPIFNHDGLSKRRCQFLADYPRNHISGSAGSEWNDNLNCASRPILCFGLHERENDEAREEKRSSDSHHFLPAAWSRPKSLEVTIIQIRDVMTGIFASFITLPQTAISVNLPSTKFAGSAAIPNWLRRRLHARVAIATELAKDKVPTGEKVPAGECVILSVLAGWHLSGFVKSRYPLMRHENCSGIAGYAATKSNTGELSC
jgi:hypothetical protein